MPKKNKEKISPKKVVYIILTIVLGGLLGCVVYGLLSINFILPSYLYQVFILAGAISGFFLGFRWWRIVYIEHRHWRNWRKRKHESK